MSQKLFLDKPNSWNEPRPPVRRRRTRRPRRHSATLRSSRRCKASGPACARRSPPCCGRSPTRARPCHGSATHSNDTGAGGRLFVVVECAACAVKGFTELESSCVARRPTTRFVCVNFSCQTSLSTRASPYCPAIEPRFVPSCIAHCQARLRTTRRPSRVASRLLIVHRCAAARSGCRSTPRPNARYCYYTLLLHTERRIGTAQTRLASLPRTRRSTDHRGRALGALEPGRPHAARLLRTVVGGWHGGGAPATRREGVPSAARHVREDAKQPVLTFGIGAADNRPFCVDVIIVLALLLWHCSFARLGSTARSHPGRPRPAATHDSPGHYNSFHADCSIPSLLEREVDPRALNLDVWRVVRVVVPLEFLCVTP